jgi:hypothetical protein
VAAASKTLGLPSILGSFVHAGHRKVAPKEQKREKSNGSRFLDYCCNVLSFTIYLTWSRKCWANERLPVFLPPCWIVLLWLGFSQSCTIGQASKVEL